MTLFYQNLLNYTVNLATAFNMNKDLPLALTNTIHVYNYSNTFKFELKSIFHALYD